MGPKREKVKSSENEKPVNSSDDVAEGWRERERDFVGTKRGFELAGSLGQRGNCNHNDGNNGMETTLIIKAY